MVKGMAVKGNNDERAILERLKRCRWAVFDLDSTLIQQETIDEMARFAGKYDIVANITKEAMEDENKSFADLLSLRLNVLKGCWNERDWAHLIGNIKYTHHVRELFHTLKGRGIKIGIVSGGFTEMVEHVGDYLGADVVLANQLEYGSDGYITGKLIGKIIDGHQKLLFLLAQTDRDEAMAVGDGSNDILMIKAASVGIAFMGKPQVMQAADYCIGVPSFDPLIDLLNQCSNE